jgi:hypothetical protein
MADTKNTPSSEKAQQTNFKAACKVARDSLTDAERNDVTARHKVGVIVREVMDEAKYGENAVGRMESELGVDEKTLYRYGKVAEVWSAKEFKKVVGQLNDKRLPLTWSHLEILAGVEDGRSRRALQARVLKECLSVRALLAATHTSPSDRPISDTQDEKATPSASIRRLGRTLAGVEREAKAMSERVMQDVGSHRENLTEEDVSRLSDALKRASNAARLLVVLSGQVREVLFPGTPKSSAEVTALVTTTTQAAPVARVGAGTV